MTTTATNQQETNGRDGVLRSLRDIGAVMTSLALGTAGFANTTMPALRKKQSRAKKEDPLEILQFIINMRLDYWISCSASSARGLTSPAICPAVGRHPNC